jgi:hypothetical protein
VIVGWNQGVSMRFISSLQLQKSMHNGCKLYAILALNEKGFTKGLEHLLVVREFVDVFPEGLQLSGLYKPASPSTLKNVQVILDPTMVGLCTWI